MIIGIDIRNIGKRRTGDEVVFFNLFESTNVNRVSFPKEVPLQLG